MNTAYFVAEREGFKPPVRINRTADFESAPFGHSGIFPLYSAKLLFFSFINSFLSIIFSCIVYLNH